MNETNQAAQALGRMARGIKKRLTDAERERRRQAMVALNKARAARVGGKGVAQ